MVGVRPAPNHVRKLLPVKTVDVLEGAVKWRPAQTDVSGPSLLVMLREASRAVDALWRDALAGGQADTAVRFGEASHGLHRALIALNVPTPEVPPPD